MSEVLLDAKALHEREDIVVLTPVAYDLYVIRIGGVSIATNGRWCTIDGDGAEDTNSGRRHRHASISEGFYGRAPGR